MKITAGNTDGKTYQFETEDSSKLVGNKIGDEFDGGKVGLSGYTLEITGGSDKQGFPMRKSIEGTARKKILLDAGAGIKSEEGGERRRKSVRGNTVSDEIEQLNVKVVEEGSKSIEELLEDEEE